MQRKSCDSARARASSAGSGRISSGCTARLGVAPPTAKATTMKARRRNDAMPLLRRLQGRPAPCGLGGADAQAPIGKRQGAAERHHDAAEPDQQYERLVIEPHRDRAVRGSLAE